MKRPVSRSAGRFFAPLGVGAVVLGAGLAPAPAWADPCNGPDGPHLNVVVDGLRSTRGDIVVEVYPDDSKRFLARQAQVNSVHQRLDHAPVSVCLTVPQAGWYAVAVFHDENSDRKFNRNALGLPIEGFGLSNNPSILLGAPAFRSVRFEIGPADTTIHVKLHYLG